MCLQWETNYFMTTKDSNQPITQHLDAGIDAMCLSVSCLLLFAQWIGLWQWCFSSSSSAWTRCSDIFFWL